MRTFKALGAILDYPTAELQAAIREIEACLVEEGVLSSRQLRALAPLLDRLGDGDLLELQEEWIALFDRSRRLGLHLHEHTYGESRDRGMAMVRLMQLYRLHGLELVKGEIPDYLPAFLEFLSLVPLASARRMLADAVAILLILAERLEAKGSPYAALFTVLAALSDRKAASEELEALRSAAPPEVDSLEALDREYEEAPVEFTSSSVLQSCPYSADAAKASRATIQPSGA
ncbi:nitrate reductase molybdenum cofactor assembly chaperone [Benzoatithermus flavus]|uniref:Nitrate reductase molybdenum cofactor assembly chaperone n=1 Tax=Benzoatithermus flavus TaxID=3108223 RepID=A0ABU8XSK5_9PROT